MKKIAKRNVLFLFIVLGVVILSSGCAGSAAGYKVLQPLKEGVSLKSYTNLELVAESKEKVPMTSGDREQIMDKIAQKVKAKAPTRFEEINPTVTKPSTIQYAFIFTRYDKGNAFARAMLAGLGQIHINADVHVKDKMKDEVLAKYRVNKGFGLGGMYGASTRIEDVQDGFVEGVVKMILKE